MATEIYYKIDGDHVYYSNTDSPEYGLRDGTGLAMTASENRYVVLETTNGKFKFVDNTGNSSAYQLFYGALNSEFDSTMDIWDISEFTNWGKLFAGCKNITSIDLSWVDASNIVDMSYMFSDCENLESINLSNWNTVACTGMSYMFSNCSSLKSIDLSSFDTTNVTRATSMFSGCSSLETLDLSNFDMPRNEDQSGYSSMFQDCTSLKTIDLSKFTFGRGQGLQRMFKNCTELVSIDLSSAYLIIAKDYWGTASYTYADEMFYNCSKLEHIYLPVGTNWNEDMFKNDSSMFYNCTSLPNFNSRYTGKSKANNLSDGYFEVGTEPDIKVYYRIIDNTVYYCNYKKPQYELRPTGRFKQAEGKEIVIVLVNDTFVFPKNSAYMFFNVTNVEFNDMDKWDTSHVESMRAMFASPATQDRKVLDVSILDVSNVYDFVSMFESSGYTEDINIVGWQISKTHAVTFDDMFAGSNKLKHIYASLHTDWNTRPSQLTCRTGDYLFLNDRLLPNVGSFDRIEKANNTGTGCFSIGGPWIPIESYIKDNDTWTQFSLYFKDSEGWNMTEIYS